MKKTYMEWVSEFPGYAVIRKEGCFYTAKAESAEILHKYLGYKIGYFNDIAVTGSPILISITDMLEYQGIPFVVIEDNMVTLVNGIEIDAEYVEVKK